MKELDRYRGCLLGLAVGDAIGTSVEFWARGSFEPVTGCVPAALATGILWLLVE